MSDQEWEDSYAEISRRDFARKIYEECDKEDAEEPEREVKNG